MPELPEVETIRRQLADEVIGRAIVDINWEVAKMLKPTPDIFVQKSIHTKMKSVERRAKYILVRLSNGYTVSMHLKLNGRILLRNQADESDKYVYVKLILDNEQEIRFADSRKFAFAEILDEEQRQDLDGRYGPEPLDDLTSELFVDIVSSSRKKIKDILLDQKMIAGVGNIYANDALWLAKIHPLQKGGNIPAEKLINLYKAILSVLEESLQLNGASDNWFRDIYGKKGAYQEKFRVYSRKGKPCQRHADTGIEYIKVSQRGTYICPKCQKI